jgi:hypothetical protein
MALDLEIYGAATELTEADAPPQTPSTTLVRLRDSHHALARNLAHGMSVPDASLATGYSIPRIHILLRDPAFRELMAHYRDRTREAVLDMEQRFLGVAADAAQEIRERLETAPETVDNDTLLDIFKVMADRAGFAPVSRSVSKNYNFNIGERLDARKRRSEDAA